jgi:hypothetical protein
MKGALSGGDQTTLDGALAAHDGVPVPDPTTSGNVPLVAIDGPRDPQDGKTTVVISPATEGWNTWLMGAADDASPTPPATGRGTGAKFVMDFAGPGSNTEDYTFLEELEIHDGQINWSNPQGDWTHEDTFSIGVCVPANNVVANGSSEGNCNVVDAQGNPGAPDATHYIIVPAAGDGAYDVDLAAATPARSDGSNTGYWDCTYDGGVVSMSATPGAAEFHLLTVEVTGWLGRNIAMLANTGIWDIDVYKTEWFHRRWKLRWEINKVSVGAGQVAGWILAFRKNVT